MDVIVNPHAGFFKSQSTVPKLIQELEQKLADLRRALPASEGGDQHGALHGAPRARPRHHGGDPRRRGRGPPPGSNGSSSGCGGDGTSNEICTALVDADGSLLDRLKLLRLPLGTGNDVADAHTFAEAYDLILGPQQTVKTGRPPRDRRPARGRAIPSTSGASGWMPSSPGSPTASSASSPGTRTSSWWTSARCSTSRGCKPQPMDIRIHGAARRDADRCLPALHGRRGHQRRAHLRRAHARSSRAGRTSAWWGR